MVGTLYCASVYIGTSSMDYILNGIVMFFIFS